MAYHIHRVESHGAAEACPKGIEERHLAGTVAAAAAVVGSPVADFAVAVALEPPLVLVSEQPVVTVSEQASGPDQSDNPKANQSDNAEEINRTKPYAHDCRILRHSRRLWRRRSILLDFEVFDIRGAKDNVAASKNISFGSHLERGNLLTRILRHLEGSLLQDHHRVDPLCLASELQERTSSADGHGGRTRVISVY